VIGNDGAALAARLCSTEGLFDKQVWAQAKAPPFGDAFLAEVVEFAPSSAKSWITAHMGDLHGDAGTAVLQRLMHSRGSGTRDVRCASVLALAKRCGPDATPWLVEALHTCDAAVKEYAVIGLAGAGDDSAWELVAARLDKVGRKDSHSFPSEVLMAVAYLGQHVRVDARRRTVLVRLVRRHWFVRDDEERDWVDEYWPDAAPYGPAAEQVMAPNEDALRTWARTDLFQPL